MIFAKKIRLRIGKKLLAKRIKTLNRDKKVCNLAKARTAGIVFDATAPGNFEAIRKLAAQLTDRNIQVQIIGYVNQKNIPDSYLLRRTVHFFCHQDLSWFFTPKSQFLKDFIDTSFDILFELNDQFQFPITYLVSLSKAKFRAGWFDEQVTHIDFMINTGDNKNMDYLIEQLLFYLGEIQMQPEPVSAES